MTSVVVEVRADPAVWLTGPRDPADAGGWVAGALAALTADFGLEPAGPGTDSLRGALTAPHHWLHLPGPDVNGLLVGATIVVSEADVPPAPEASRETDVLALLAADDTHWVRVEQTVADPGAVVAKQPDPGLPTRRVSGTGLRPGHPPRWVLFASSCVGDGDPTSADTDAVMGTWVWARATDAPAVLPEKESA